MARRERRPVRQGRLNPTRPTERAWAAGAQTVGNACFVFCLLVKTSEKFLQNFPVLSGAGEAKA
jgi:hypothetical protein